MKTHSSMLHVRMDTEMKRKATAALAAMGLTASEAVRLFRARWHPRGAVRMTSAKGIPSV